MQSVAKHLDLSNAPVTGLSWRRRRFAEPDGGNVALRGRLVAATRYLHNALNYILSDETGFSTPLPTLSLGKVDLTMCGLVNLGFSGTNAYGQTPIAWVLNMAGGRVAISRDGLCGS